MIHIPKNKKEELKGICAEFRNQPNGLKTVLIAAQSLFGYVPVEVQMIVASELDVSITKINDIVALDPFLSLTPTGKYPISICLGTECYKAGADKVLRAFEQELNIKMGETTKDGKFSLDCLRCVGTCKLAPIVFIAGKTYGKVHPDKVKSLVSQCIYSNE